MMRSYDEFTKTAANYYDGIKTLRRRIPFDKKFDIIEKAMLANHRRYKLQKSKWSTMSGYQQLLAAGKDLKNSVIIRNAIDKLDRENMKRAYSLLERLNNQE